MYTIEITTKRSITEKQKNVLMQSVQEADGNAECQIGSMSCLISGSNVEPQQLCYLLGIAVGGSSPSEIIRLLLSYEERNSSV